MKDPESDDASNFMLTRAGSFDEDENGYLVNDAGYYLAGFVYDDEGSLGGVDRNSFTMMEAINTNGVTMTAQASSEASISGNLPSSMTATGTPQDPFISSMSYYTPLGEQQIMSFAWTPSDTVANQWSVEISDENGTTYGTVVVDFSDSGATAGSPLSYSGTPDAGLTAPAAFSVDANGNISLVIDNGATPQTLEIALGTPGSYDGITQFDGDYEPQTMIVDGSSTAALESTEVDENGNFVGVFANGERVSMYQIPVATVDNPEGMVAVSGNAWQLSLTSGSAVMNVSGGNAGTILTGVTEASNVELAEEMTSLIQVQRAYSSNTTIITTSDEMLQEVNNLKR